MFTADRKRDKYEIIHDGGKEVWYMPLQKGILDKYLKMLHLSSRDDLKTYAQIEAIYLNSKNDTAKGKISLDDFLNICDSLEYGVLWNVKGKRKYAMPVSLDTYPESLISALTDVAEQGLYEKYTFFRKDGYYVSQERKETSYFSAIEKDYLALRESFIKGDSTFDYYSKVSCTILNRYKKNYKKIVRNDDRKRLFDVLTLSTTLRDTVYKLLTTGFYEYRAYYTVGGKE